MFQLKLLKKVIEGTSANPGTGVGWLTKELELPFLPTLGLQLSFPYHAHSLLPSSDESIEIALISWSCRSRSFTGICTPHHLIDLKSPDFSETDLVGYLARQVSFAWDSSMKEADCF